MLAAAGSRWGRGPADRACVPMIPAPTGGALRALEERAGGGGGGERERGVGGCGHIRRAGCAARPSRQVAVGPAAHRARANRAVKRARTHTRTHAHTHTPHTHTKVICSDTETESARSGFQVWDSRSPGPEFRAAFSTLDFQVTKFPQPTPRGRRSFI